MAKLPKFICINKKSYLREIERAIKALERQKPDPDQAIDILKRVEASLIAEKPCTEDKQAII